MPSYDSTLFNITPYFDDYDETKKFLRVLFRPGYAVQARELTQLQTILQNQIERFGNHIFQDGSKVYGGEIATSKVRYQRILTTNSDGADVPLDQLIGYEITSGSSKAKVIHAIESNGGKDDYKVLFFTFLQGSSFTEGSNFTTSYAGAGWNGTFASRSDDAEDATKYLSSNGLSGDSNIVSVNDGIFYIDGYFVKNDLQKFTPYTPSGDSSTVRDFVDPTTSVGFNLSKESVSDASDLTLRDPSSGSYNYNAPGADRYAIKLQLSQSTTYGKDFLELVKYESGKPTKKLLKTSYSEIEKTLARRTYDESGSYTTKPFEIDVREHADDGTNRGVYSGASGDTNKLAVGLATGKAYVFGHEYETQKTHFVNVDKARTTSTSNSREIDTNVGAYIEGAYACQDHFVSYSGAPSNYGSLWKDSLGFGKYIGSVIDDGLTINLHDKMPFYNSNNQVEDRRWPLFYEATGHQDNSQLGTGDLVNADLAPIIGTAKIKMIIETDESQISGVAPNVAVTVPTYRVYLYDISMDDGKAISDVCMMTYTDMAYITATDFATKRDTATNANQMGRDAEVGDNRHKILFVGGDVGGWSDNENRENDCNLATQPIDSTGLKGNNNYIIPIPEGPAVVNLNTIEFRKVVSTQIGSGDTTLSVTDFAGVDDTHRFVGEGEQDGPMSPTSKNNGYLLVSTVGGFSIPLEEITMSLIENKKTLIINTIDASPNLYDTGHHQYLSGDDTYTLYATVQVRDTETATPTPYRRTKTLTNKLYTNINGSIDRVLTDEEGQSYFQLPDVDIWKIYGITGGTGDANDTNLKGDFIFDNGQRDDRYDYGRLYIKPDKVRKYTGDHHDTTPSVTLNISYDHFSHSGSGLPFTVNSYDGFDYKDIPLYTIEETGQVVSLSNVLDFRSSRVARDSELPEVDRAFISGGFPKTGIASGDVIYESHEYYLPRIDKIILKKDISTDDHSFEVIKGIPSLDPQAPSDREDALTLYILSVPPYTYNPFDVNVQYIDNQRYTMSDIGKLDKRISNLEYYSTLSSLESEIEGKNILSYDGSTIAFKKGILVDSFKGCGVADVSHPNYACSIDFENGQLRPSFLHKNIDLSQTSITNAVESTDGILTLGQDTPVEFVSQVVASRTLKVNPFNLVNWLGTSTIDPPGDNWFDVDYRPIVKINARGENDNWKVCNFEDNSVGTSASDVVDLEYLNSKGFGSQWNDWESMWSGIEIVSSNIYDEEGRNFIDKARVFQPDDDDLPSLQENNTNTISKNAFLTSQNKTRLGVRVRTLPNRLRKVVSGKTVDVTIVPYMRSKILTVNAYGLKPNTTVYPFFDAIDVSTYCEPENGLTGGVLTTNDNGSIENLLFRIPEGKFLTGEKVFRLTDNSKNNVSSTTTASDVTYHASGISNVRDSGIVSTRPPIVKRQTVTSENIPTDVFNRRNSLNSQTNTLWVDPLAQTFYVEPNAYPSGLFLHSIDLYFAKKDSTLPITLEIRPTTNGYPHPSVVAPFSQVTKMPSDINVDDISPTSKTTFTFTSPVYLETGEYAIVLSTNSEDYELYSATIGENKIGTSDRITSAPYAGSLFYPQNESIAEPDYTTDLMFAINRYAFDSVNGEVVFSNDSGGPVATRRVDCDTFKINAREFIPSGTNMTHTAQFEAGLAFSASLNENITKGNSVSNKKINKGESNFKITSTLNYASDSAITPVIDTKMLDVTCIENSINAFTSSIMDEEKKPLTDWESGGARARYITRRVTLLEGMGASDLKVFLSVYKPSGSNAKVLMKYSDGTSDINTNSYVELEVKNDSDNFTSSSAFDFREIEYSLKQEDYDSIGDGNIKTFVIKVCLFGNDDEVPAVKDLRAVALD